MSTETVDQLDEWRQNVLSGWTDNRIVDALWIDTHIWFFLHLYADLAKVGLELTGWTFREKHAVWLLVLKVSGGDVPQVAFINGKTPTSCMRQTRNLLRDGGLKLSRDKYG